MNLHAYLFLQDFDDDMIPEDEEMVVPKKRSTYVCMYKSSSFCLTVTIWQCGMQTVIKCMLVRLGSIIILEHSDRA